MVARFYPGITERNVERSLWNMVMAAKVLALRSAKGRQLLRGAAGAVSQKFQALVMTQGPNPRCSQWDQPLLELFETVQERLPELLLQLNAHLTYNAPLGEEFEASFE